MAELAIGQIIKMTLAIFVIVIVIGGVALAFYQYIIPYFKGLGPSKGPDLTSPFYTDLIKNGITIGIVPPHAKGEDYISIYDDSGKSRTTKYYFEDDGDIRERKGWYRWDTLVGKVDVNTAQIKMEKDYENVPELKKINGGYRIGNEIRKLR
jgi:hypothetical protein